MIDTLFQLLEEQGISPGDSSLLINGINLDIDTVDMFNLYEMLKRDLKIMDELGRHGLAVSQVSRLHSVVLVRSYLLLIPLDRKSVA